MFSLTIIGVVISAIYKDWLYLRAISNDTQALSEQYGAMAQNQTVINELGLNAADLSAIQEWSWFDATGNRLTLYARLIMTLAISGHQLKNALGMIAGVPVGIYEWFKGKLSAPATRELVIEEIEKDYSEFQAFAEQHPDLIEQLRKVLLNNVTEEERTRLLHALLPAPPKGSTESSNAELPECSYRESKDTRIDMDDPLIDFNVNSP